MEEFRAFDNEWSFSNLGNVLHNGKPYVPGKANGYQFIMSNGKMVRVQTIIGKLFQDYCGEWKPGYHTHHIDRNRSNNNVSNLRNLSPSEHKKLHQYEDGVMRPVVAYNENGDKVGEFESLTEAQNVTGAFQTHIGRACRGERYTAGGLYWIFKDDPEYNSKVEAILVHGIHRRVAAYYEKINARNGLLARLRNAVKELKNEEIWLKHRVYVTNYKTGKIEYVKSPTEASNLYGVAYPSLCDKLRKGEGYVYGDYVFWKK